MEPALIIGLTQGFRVNIILSRDWVNIDGVWIGY